MTRMLAAASMTSSVMVLSWLILRTERSGGTVALARLFTASEKSDKLTEQGVVFVLAAAILWTLEMLRGTTASDTRMVVPQTHPTSGYSAERVTLRSTYDVSVAGSLWRGTVMIPEIRVTAVQQGTVPPYAYTQDATALAGRELVCAGALRYDVHEIDRILRACAADLAHRSSLDATPIYVEGLGTFASGTVEPDWVEALQLGARMRERRGNWVQIVPVDPAPTVDSPDMAKSLGEGRDPVWQWLVRPWDLPVPSESHLVTTLGVLTKSSPPVSVFRWEVDQWEALDRPADQVVRDTVRVTPIGLLAAVVADYSLALSLGIGEGLQRVGSAWIRT